MPMWFDKLEPGCGVAKVSRGGWSRPRRFGGEGEGAKEFGPWADRVGGPEGDKLWGGGVSLNPLVTGLRPALVKLGCEGTSPLLLPEAPLLYMEVRMGDEVAPLEDTGV